MKALVAEGLEVDWRVTIQHEGPGRAAYTAAALRGVGVTHVIVGSEPGVSLHAELTSYFADSPVPAEKIELRRNKYLQSEAVRAAGIPNESERRARGPRCKHHQYNRGGRRRSAPPAFSTKSKGRGSAVRAAGIFNKIVGVDFAIWVDLGVGLKWIRA